MPLFEHTSFYKQNNLLPQSTPLQISIAGMGYLGSSFAAILLQKYLLAVSTASMKSSEQLEKKLLDGWQELTEAGVITKNVAANFATVSNKLCVLRALPFFLHGSSEAKNKFYSRHLRVLVVCFPPSGAKEEGKDSLHSYADAVVKLAEPVLSREEVAVIFISSTSVYGHLPAKSATKQPLAGTAVFTEADAGLPVTVGGKKVWLAEEALRSVFGRRLICLRLGGLVGGERNFLNFYNKRGGVLLGYGATLVNLVHRVDVTMALCQVLEKLIGKTEGTTHLSAAENKGVKNLKVPAWQEMAAAYNVVSTSHPSREQLYTAVAKKYGLPPPVFKGSSFESSRTALSGEGIPKKIVDSSLLRSQLGFRGIYDDLQSLV